ncbi:hypothetical protein [Salsuginibacillus kocurii]|uniref:hypothetical protein n=1 Tax=Salsuginibacillus kocurii TaxID=427078 RepID=UPI00037037A6|nr:hypothetical protein [Salsuginibacillus kocurii]
MSFIRSTGKFLGGAAGAVLGSPFKIVGELSNKESISSIGDGIYHSSKFAGDTVGQATEGVVDTTYGLIQDDTAKRDQGLHNWEIQ